MDFLKSAHIKFAAKFLMACAVLAPFAEVPLPAGTKQAIDPVTIGIIVALVVSVAVSVTAALLAPKPDIEEPEASGLGDYGFPTNLESRYIPVVWGSTRIDGPNVIWYGDLHFDGLSTGGKTVGYQYSLGIDMALCWGEVESVTALELDTNYMFKAGDVLPGNGTTLVPQNGFVGPTNGHRRIFIEDRNFTGGDKKGGGFSGNVSFYYGTDDQPVSEYVRGAMDEANQVTELPDGSEVPTSTLVPAYPGIARMVWEGGYLTERAVAPQFKVHVQRFPTSLSQSFSKVRDNGTTADANPIHVIYEILTDTNWGLSIDPQLIDRDSFTAAAGKCHEEGNGFSLTIQSPKQAKGVIDDINKQVNGMLYQNAEGLFEYTLVRKTYRESDNAILDYDGDVVSGETVPSLDPSSIIAVKSASRQGWEETFNTIHVKYRDRNEDFKETVANAQDSGNLAIRKGKRSVKTEDMQGIRHPETAAIVAQRLLRSGAYPITTVDLEVSRRYSYLRPGAVIEINHPDFGLHDFYLRVLDVGLPKDTKGNVRLKGMRDVFDEPTNATTVQVGGSASLQVIEDGTPVAPDITSSDASVTGLPDFYSRKLGLDANEVHTWHLFAAPNSSTVSGQAFQEDTGTYEAVTDEVSLYPKGSVVGHVNDLWTNRNYAYYRYNRSSDGTDCFKNGGAYARTPGPNTNPIRHNTNTRAYWYEGKGNGAMDLWDADGLRIGTVGDMLVRNISNGRDQLLGATHTEEQIKNHGFGLALIRPAWADGDPRYEEIIAYEGSSDMTIYYGQTYIAGNTGTGVPTYFPKSKISLSPPSHDTYEAHNVMSLTGVYRGLLDTRIQCINTDSEIIFLGANDPMYDLVGQNQASVVGQTYRHSFISAGGATDPEDAPDRSVTASELQRRNLPLPPAQLKVGIGNWAQKWGYNRYDGGEWDRYEELHGGASTNDLVLSWSTHDAAQDVGVIKLQSETDVLVTSHSVDIRLQLVDDDRTPDATHRYRHALAFYKEGWLPTSPALAHNGRLADIEATGSSTTVELPLAGDVQLTAQGGSGTATVSNLRNQFFSGTFTSGQHYYLIVTVQQRDGTLVSRGGDRFIYLFQAP